MLHTRLALTRPLAIFDCETTGRFPDRDRIVEITIKVLYPNGEASTFSSLVDPTVAIPADVTAIHGISDAMVQGQPTFRALAPTLATMLAGCDLAGYNVRRFDAPLLVAEFARTPVAFSLDGRHLVDAYVIFCKLAPRDLAAAVRTFCGREHDGAHRTRADVDATIAVLEGQLDMYAELPRTVGELHAYGKDPLWIDDTGRLVWIAGVACLGFGKEAGRSLQSLASNPQGRDYLRWMLAKDFPSETKRIIADAMQGHFPTPTPTASEVGA